MRRVQKLTSRGLAILAVAYLLLLCFPQPLFAYSTDHGSFKVYSREPAAAALDAVLKKAEARLGLSPIYDASIKPHVYLSDSFGLYALLSHKAYRSFANSVPVIDNVIVNKSDIAADRVFLNREKNNSRSLSGVIAHEAMHLFIRSRYGALHASLLPAWKNEGYCEYIAQDSTITLDEGIRLWRENPEDDSGYRHVKYHLMVRHLLENEDMTVDDLFSKRLDEKEVSDRTLAALTFSRSNS